MILVWCVFNEVHWNTGYGVILGDKFQDSRAFRVNVINGLPNLEGGVGGG